MPLTDELTFHLAYERDRSSKPHEPEAQKIARELLNSAVLQGCALGH
jgi:hypothetical protein